MSKTNLATKERPSYSLYIKAIFVSLIISVGLVLIFALLIKAFNLSDAIILPVNIAIKIISIFVATLIVMKENNRGALKGIVVGGIYIVFSFLLFSVLSKDFSISIKFLYDIIFGIIIGGISGIISKNIRK